MANNISFIIPCFNCSDTIDEAIMSIINTNLENGDEIVLIDDASTDDTLNKILDYENRYKYVKVLRHLSNKGTAAAGRNTGIDYAKNELIFCLDSDNILKANTIKRLKGFLIENELDVAAFGTIEYFNKIASNVTSTWVLSEKLNFVDGLNDPMKTPCGSGNFLYRKAAWKKAGRYNESIGGAYDSEIFGLRLLAEGAKFWTLANTSYLHRSDYESTFIREYNKRNKSLLFLAGLIEYWHLVDEDDVEYIFGKARLTWMDNIEERPLRQRVIKKKSLYKRMVNKVKRVIASFN